MIGFNKISIIKASKNLIKVNRSLFLKGIAISVISGALELLFLWTITLFINGSIFSVINNINTALGLIIIVLVILWAKVYFLGLINIVGSQIALESLCLYSEWIINTSYRDYLFLDKSKLQFEFTKSYEQLYLAYCAPLFNLIMNITLGMGIFYILVIDSGLIITSGIMFIGITYMLIIKANNKNLRKHILNRHNSEITLSDSVNEIIWGYKDIKINNLKEIALSNYRLTLSNFKNSLTNIQYSGIWPKNIIEGIFLVGIATIVYMINTNNLNLSILEVTSSLVVILKFIPTTNAIYLNSHTLNAHESALEDIFESNRRSRTDLNNTQTLSSENINKQTLKNSISIKINEFYYDKANYILNLSPFEKTFSKGEINFIIGASGSGKSTLLDILGGLYPEPGIKICEQDNEDILINKSEYVHEYISNLAYAPQKFYPFENSLIYNITLTHESLDTMTKKEKNNLLNAMDIANLPLDFLDKQYNLSISTLSGGQLQRVGLARAIYRNKYILLLDEVTSALDFTTKMHVLKKLSTLAKSTIIICVTHDKQIIQNFKSKSVTELI